MDKNTWWVTQDCQAAGIDDVRSTALMTTTSETMAQPKDKSPNKPTCLSPCESVGLNFKSHTSVLTNSPFSYLRLDKFLCHRKHIHVSKHSHWSELFRMWQCVSFCGAIRNTIVFSLPRDVLLP
jgi:hypothetical protein